MKTQKYYLPLILFLFSLSLWAQDIHYNEVFDDAGNVRQKYKQIYEQYKTLSFEQKQNIMALTSLDFQGDNMVHPLPRILDQSEYQILKKGVEQRGKAISLFLKDHYSGAKNYSRVIPQDVIAQIIDRNGETAWGNYIKPENVSFWYGPDIIRDNQGNFRVIEDNPGFIGGVGDLELASESLTNRMTDYKKSLKPVHPKFYDQMLNRYKQLAGDGEVVLLQYADDLIADNEDLRTQKLFEKRGVTTVKIDPYNPDKKTGPNKLIIEDDGVYVENKMGKKKVGFIIGNVDPLDFDPSHEGNRYRKLMDEAHFHLDQKEVNGVERSKLEKLMMPEAKTGKVNLDSLELYLRRNSPILHYLDAKSPTDGLMTAVLNGKVKMNYSPGLEFMGDKEFYTYVDDMVRFYLKEEPIISNITTQSFRKFEGGKGVLNSQLVDEVFNNMDKYVVKKVDGRGGDAVWVGPKMDKAELPDVKARVLSEPHAYIVQEYTPLSEMDDFIVDLRVISDVQNNKVIVTDTPWGRAVPKKGNGKVNISDLGSETAVFVLPDNPCNMVWH
ncbi:MAG: circularly permuted type 2 ATP-grasp protein [Bacteriovoracaceae bacterium]